MKKISAIIGAALFALGFGVAYAGSGLYNGVTDFKGKANDTFRIGPASVLDNTYESSAAGSQRLIEGPSNASRHIHDTFEIETPASKRRDAAGTLSHNFGGNLPPDLSYDTIPMNPALER